MKAKAAIIGSGNIGTDLMIKIQRTSETIELAALVGIDADSDGLSRAREMGIATTHEGLDGLVKMEGYADIKVVFDATSAAAHAGHSERLTADGKQVIDLTPAAVGPFVVPVVNMDEHLGAANMNMVTCGGQATIPIVAAVRRASERVVYAEIVASISSASAGPGTRANIDEFTVTTAKGIETVGGAERGKAIIVLNSSKPPLIMRDTVFVLSQGGDEAAITESIERMVEEVQAYVPGYRLKQAVQFERFGDNQKVNIPEIGPTAGLKTSVFLEVEGAAHYLPAYAGNLDIMTSSALATAERWVEIKLNSKAA